MGYSTDLIYTHGHSVAVSDSTLHCLYSLRINEFSDIFFNFSYRIIAFPLLSKVETGPNTCKKILAAAGISGYEIGKTKVSCK